MLTVAVASQKGGTGKTMLGVNLAVAAEGDGRSTAVLDIDPQGSASVWEDLRERERASGGGGDTYDAVPVVVSAQPARLETMLRRAEGGGAALAFIDTAGSAEFGVVPAVRAADLVLIPFRAGIADLHAIQATADVAGVARTPAVAVLNAAPPRSREGDQAVEAVSSLGIDVAPVRLGHRIAFVRAFTAGKSVLEYEPAGKAAEEVRALYRFLIARADALEGDSA